MFDTSIHGPLLTADESALTSSLTGAPGTLGQAATELTTDAFFECPSDETVLVVCADCDDTGGVIDLGDTGIIIWTAPEPEPPQDADTGVIDLGDTGTIVKRSPDPTPGADCPPSDDNDGPDIGYLSLAPLVLLTGSAIADVLVGGAANEQVLGFGGDDVLRGRGGDDLMSGGRGADTITGNSGRDLIEGNGGTDVIRAGVGADLVFGGAGADVINGGRGADILNGGGGDDTIVGRAGDDTLSGNGGADVFQFRASDRNDTILDFQQEQDRIEFLNGASSFADLSVEQEGADVVITFGLGQITVISDDAASFDANDFIF